MNQELSSTMEQQQRYRISTITATASLNTEINLDILYQCLKPLCLNDNNEGIVYIEFGKKKVETVFKGYSKKFNKKMTNTKATKRFDNQVTIVYRAKLNNNIVSMINTKIFKNGNIQMTGIRNIEQGNNMVNIISDIIHRLYITENNIVTNIENLRCINYKLRLINSDFKLNYIIHREQLYSILMSKYGITASYEPCIYPAVKVKYYYNDENINKNGICNCSKKCIIGKGSGCGDKSCKKVTIAIFQSGCIIITGGQTLKQVDEAYDFITRILTESSDKIRKKNVDNISDEVTNQIKFLVKTSNIKNNNLMTCC
jgi:TATA-box binding protein (TBP) (component of TFIID and TFIIIB)